MLNRDFSNSTLNIIKATRPDIVPAMQPDFQGAFNQAVSGFNEGMHTKQMIEEHPEDKARIRQMGGRAYADMLKSDAQRAEDRQWHLDDLAAQRQFQRDLLADKLRNEFALEQYKASFGGDTNAQRNVDAMVQAGYTPQEAWAMYYGGNNPTLDMASLGQKGQEAYDKKMGENAADEVMAQKQMETLTPMAQAARDRAKNALEDGTGLGQIGGLGWTTGKGGRNREDVASVKRQMNIMLRSKLKAVGVGSKELDAAREAEAYRANLEPTLPIEQQEAIIDNFFTDYVNGNLEKELRAKYGKPSLKQVNQMLTDPRVQEALDNGYSMEEIQNYLRK